MPECRLYPSHHETLNHLSLDVMPFHPSAILEAKDMHAYQLLWAGQVCEEMGIRQHSSTCKCMHQISSKLMDLTTKETTGTNFQKRLETYVSLSLIYPKLSENISCHPNIKDEAVPVQAMKAYQGVEIWQHTFLPLALDGGPVLSFVPWQLL